MASPINTEVMPGDTMTPATIDIAAWNLRSIGSQVSTQGGTVVTTWQRISASYDAPEEQTLFAAMNPVKTDAETFGSNVGTVATALETFAEEVRTIKAAVAKIRADAATFLGTIEGGKVTKTYYGGGDYYTDDFDWATDQESVDANNALIQRTNDQQEKLWAAERTCANAIYDVIGAAHIGPATAENCGNGYGVTDIPDNAAMPWGAAVEREESCLEKAGEGVVVDGLGGMVEGVTSLVGFSWSGPDGAGFSWSTLGNSWKGVGMLGVGAVVNSVPGGQVLVNTVPGPVGSFLRDGTKALNQTAAGLVAIDPYAEDPFEKWKDDPWRAGGASLFNVVTLFAAPTKVGNAGRAGRAGELAGDASRVAEGAGALSRAARAAESAISRVTAPTVDALNTLFRRADLDDAINVGTDGTKVEVPSVGRHDVGTDTPNVGTHGDDAPPPRDNPGSNDANTPPVDSTPGDGTPGDSTPGDSTPGDSTPGDSTPGDSSPGDSTPGERPAGSGDGTAASPRVYEYANPAESLRDAPQPTGVDLSDVGPSRSHPAGSQEHMTARWRDYVDDGGQWSWDRWRDNYIRNQGHHARGVAYEEAFWDTRQFSPDEWSRNTSVREDTGVNRNYDVVSTGDQVAYELKSGDKVDAGQLAKDERLSRAGWEVNYVFGREPSAGVIRQLEDAGISWEVFHGQPVLAP